LWAPLKLWQHEWLLALTVCAVLKPLQQAVVVLFATAQQPNWPFLRNNARLTLIFCCGFFLHLMVCDVHCCSRVYTVLVLPCWRGRVCLAKVCMTAGSNQGLGVWGLLYKFVASVLTTGM
jgi:hypothetical protein